MDGQQPTRTLVQNLETLINEQVAAPKSDRTPYAVIVTIEGLGTNLVGCYGGAIAPTKNWDRFASRGIVFDQFWSDTFHPGDILESMWTGTHFVQRNATRADTSSESPDSLWQKALLVTDSMRLIEELSDERFGNVLLVDSEADPHDEAPACQFERLLEAALGRWATSLDEFPILWIHSQGLSGVWDAPYEYRTVMCDEGDPEPPADVEPANLKIASDTDPDEVFGWACAAGGQAMAMDEAWSMIENVLGELGVSENCLQILAGVCGYPMGEHGWVGWQGQSLYAETLHAPLILIPGKYLPLGMRVPFMVQPPSLRVTLENWFEILAGNQHVRGTAHPVRSVAMFGGTDLLSHSEASPPQHWARANQLALSQFQDQVHLCVPAWSCRWVADQVELFAMPDDRWQQNEVSLRAQHIVEELTDQKDACLRKCNEGETAGEVAPLSSELTHPIR